MSEKGLGCVKTRRPQKKLFVQHVSDIQFESTFDCEIELKNVILVAFRFFAFLHSQGHSRRSDHAPVTSAYLSIADLQQSSWLS